MVKDSLVSLPEVAIAFERMNGVVTFIRNSPENMRRFKETLAVLRKRMKLPTSLTTTTRYGSSVPILGDVFSRRRCISELLFSILDVLVDIKEDQTEPS